MREGRDGDWLQRGKAAVASDSGFGKEERPHETMERDEQGAMAVGKDFGERRGENTVEIDT